MALLNLGGYGTSLVYTILIQRGGGAGKCFYGGGHEVKITQPGTRDMFYTLAPDALKSEDLNFFWCSKTFPYRATFRSRTRPCTYNVRR
jgi:hypothetical protein